MALQTPSRTVSRWPLSGLGSVRPRELETFGSPQSPLARRDDNAGSEIRPADDEVRNSRIRLVRNKPL